jgi:hypothetical protein
METGTPSRGRRAGVLALGVLALAGCGRLDELTYQPATTPEQWCQQRPCVEVGGTVWTEPLGSFLVFTLAALWVAAGVYFLVTRRSQRSRAWLGVALVLGGVGAAQAGISYQAFSYVLKCEGRDLCVLTNGFEVGYSVTQALSVSAMLIAVAFACARGGGRRGLIWYAGINAGVYVVLSIVGVLLPSALLLSFSVLMLFALPGIVIVIVVAARRYRQTRDQMDRSLVVAAVLLVVVQVAYYAYYAAGITATLYDGGRGFYFSENDVLHVGMILWLGYVVFVVGKHLRDNVDVDVSGESE